MSRQSPIRTRMSLRRGPAEMSNRAQTSNIRASVQGAVSRTTSAPTSTSRISTRTVAIRGARTTGTARVNTAAAARTSTSGRASITTRTAVPSGERVATLVRERLESRQLRNGTATRSTTTASRVSTRRNVSNSVTNVEKVDTPPRTEETVMSPFYNTANTNSRRASLFAVSVFYCPICMLNITYENRRILATPCGHVFCDVCLQQVFSNKKVCPLCQQAISSDFLEIFL